MTYFNPVTYGPQKYIVWPYTCKHSGRLLVQVSFTETNLTWKLWTISHSVDMLLNIPCTLLESCSKYSRFGCELFNSLIIIHFINILLLEHQSYTNGIFHLKLSVITCFCSCFSCSSFSVFCCFSFSGYKECSVD